MNHAMSFDTLAYVKKLELHGVVAEQAQAHAEALADILEPTFITKKEQQQMVDTLSQNIQLLGIELRAEMTEFRTEMANLKTELKTGISSLRADLIKWGVGIAFAQAALIISLIKFIH